MIRIERRLEQPRWLSVVVPVVSIAVAFVFATTTKKLKAKAGTMIENFMGSLQKSKRNGKLKSVPN